ncbi:MAG: crotonyl-CoA carboxylase/reductase [Dehalococcoidia bacterium]
MPTATKDLYELGETPPLGHVPPKMHAMTIRRENFGAPESAFRAEVVDTPQPGPREVLVYVLAAGVNYNNVWAALGIPVDVVRVHAQSGDDSGFHIGGSDASGIVYAVGERVTNVKAGDEVVIHCGAWDPEAPDVKASEDPMFARSFQIWGYETNWGSFAQFTKVWAHQCMPKAKHLTWEEAAAPTLVGSTVQRMLTHWTPHNVRQGDVVLVWGTGGLGSMAIQITRALGGTPVAVVSSEAKGEYAKKLGAAAWVNRKDFHHWGLMPHWQDEAKYNEWITSVRGFQKAIWDAIGERRSPRIVFEHPGEDTIPTSIVVADTGGMVVICAGTTGYSAGVDLRYLWMRQKRLQGSHFANDDEAYAFNRLVVDGKIDPCLARTFRFEETGLCHQLMYEGKNPEGNMAILVGAPREGMKDVP